MLKDHRFLKSSCAFHGNNWRKGCPFQLFELSLVLSAGASHSRVVKNGKFSSVSVTVGSDLTVTLLLMSVECFSCCKHGFSKMVFRSRKKLEELRKPQIAPVVEKGSQPSCTQRGAGRGRWPWQWRSFGGWFRCSHCWQTLLCVQLLAMGFASTAIRHPEQQERREPLIYKIHPLADLRCRSSLILVLWEQELTCVPWSLDIHPTLGRRGRSITTRWQCLCDPLRTATVARKSLLGGLPALPGNRRQREDNEWS